MERPDLYVLARFLGVLAAPGKGWTRTRLQPAVGLNYDLFRKYLGFLVERGWVAIEADPAGDRVALTGAGVAAHRELTAWLARWLDGGLFNS